MSEKLPWFRFYAGDWLNDEFVRKLSFAQRGIYMELLCYQWREGSIPSDPKEIASLLHMTVSRFEKHWLYLASAFQNTVGKPTRLQNRRLEIERGKQQATSQKQRNIANARWEKGLKKSSNGHNDAMALQGQQCDGYAPKNQNQSQSQNQSTSNNTSSSLCTTKTNSTPPIPPKGGVKDEKEEKALEILGYLMQKTNRRFSPTAFRLKLIKERLKETHDDIPGIRLMIDRMVERWTGTEQQEFLTPDTLFRKSKFISYYDNRELPLFKNAQSRTIPPHKQLETIDTALLNHPCNPESTCATHDTTQAEKEDYQKLRANRRALVRSMTGIEYDKVNS